MFSCVTQMITHGKPLEDQAYKLTFIKHLSSRSRDRHLVYYIKCLADQVNVETTLTKLLADQVQVNLCGLAYLAFS